MGNDGLTDAEIGELEEIAGHISDTERRAMAAERETADRLIAAYLADRVGATFRGAGLGPRPLRPVRQADRDGRRRLRPGLVDRARILLP